MHFFIEIEKSVGKHLQHVLLLALVSIIFIGIVGCNEEEKEALRNSDLEGTWRSPECEHWPDGSGGQMHLERVFTMDESDWEVEFTLFSDETCESELFTANVTGPFQLGELSDVVEGATEGDFHITSIVWTARNEEMAATFAQLGCGTGQWEVDVPKDISETGCMGVAHPVSECPTEYDIVHIEGNRLFFGERSANICSIEGRPQALNPSWVQQD